MWLWFSFDCCTVSNPSPNQKYGFWIMPTTIECSYRFKEGHVVTSQIWYGRVVNRTLHCLGWRVSCGLYWFQEAPIVTLTSPFGYKSRYDLNFAWVVMMMLLFHNSSLCDISFILQLAMDLFKERARKLVEENISSALNKLKSRTRSAYGHYCSV